MQRFISVDPHAENYYSISPYAYVANNPILFIDPDGRDIYRHDKKTGGLVLFKKTDDKFDQIGKFKYDKDNDQYVLKTNKKGKAKVSINNIEKGILKGGINFKTDDQVIAVGGKNQPTLKGVENFLVKFSDYIDKEIAGLYLSKKNKGDVSSVYIDEYKGNSSDNASMSIRHDLVNGADMPTQFHTHLSRFDASDKYRPSERDKKFKSGQNVYFKRFIILSDNPDGPIEY